MKRKLVFGAIGVLFTFGLLFLLFALLPVSAESCPNESTHCPGDPNGDGQINCIDITQTELCILNPVKYPNENYPGWDANGDGNGPNSGDVLGVEYRTMEMWPHNHVRIHSPNEFPYCTNFDATVHVTYVEDFDSGVYDVIYNSSVLEVVEVTAGKINFVNIPVTNYSFPTGPGMVRIENDINGSSGVSGSGYFSTIKFHVIGSACDVSELNFNESNCYLYDISAEAINATWQGDSVHVASTPPTPTPTPTASTTATASPTATISPTVSPTPSPTASPTITCCPYTPTVSPTVSPTASPSATPTETAVPTLVPYEWAYNQSGTVTTSGDCGALYNYQMQLTLHYDSGVNNGSDIYLGGNCQPDFDDVRFAKGEWLPLLDYWVEKVNVGVDATVWVEFDTISISGTDFYIYYGNLNASSASDGEATFIFFDDFSGTSLDASKWTTSFKDGGGSVSVNGGVCTVQSNSGIWASAHLYSKSLFGINTRLRAYVKNNETTPNHDLGFKPKSEGMWTWNNVVRIENPGDEIYIDKFAGQVVVGGVIYNGPMSDVDTDWHIYDISRGSTSCEFYVDTDHAVLNVSLALDMNVWARAEAGASSGVRTLKIDWITLGSHSTCEPTISWGWAYSQSGTVTASGACGNLSNYQMQLTLHYGSGTNSGNDFYLDGNCQADFDDVRFTKADGVSLLDYWVEKVNAGIDATVWVEFDTISISGTNFYIYYGNPGATSASDGYATFMIFNDGTSLDGWVQHSRGASDNWSSVDGALRCTHMVGAKDYWSNLYYNEPIGTDYYVAECDIRAQDGLSAVNYQQGISYEVYYPMARWLENIDCWQLRDTLEWGDGSWTNSSPDSGFDAREWHKYTFVKNGNDWEMWVDGDLKVTRSAKDVSQYIGMYAYMQYTGHWAEFDDFRVRNYCDPEPTVSWEPTCTVATYDDFNDNTSSPCMWAVYYEGSGPTVNETNQRLEMVIPANSSGDLSSGAMVAKYYSVCRLTGNFDMQVDYQLIDWPSENGVRIALGVEVAPITHVRGYPVERISFGVDDFTGWPREVYLTHFDDGVRGATSTSDLSGKLRLVRAGATLSGYYYSNDSWVLVHSGPGPATDVCIVLPAWSEDQFFADQQVRIAFDNFVINQGDFNCEPMATPTPTESPTPSVSPTVSPTPSPTITCCPYSPTPSATVTESPMPSVTLIP